eukprot:1152096-Pelagomonas_calceolata.AAC.2
MPGCESNLYLVAYLLGGESCTDDASMSLGAASTAAYPAYPESTGSCDDTAMKLRPTPHKSPRKPGPDMGDQHPDGRNCKTGKSTGQAHARPHLGSRNPSSGEKARRYLRGAGLACLEGIRKEDKAVQV